MKDKFVSTIINGIYEEKESSIYQSVLANEVLKLYIDDSSSIDKELFGINLNNKLEKPAILIDQITEDHALQDHRISKFMLHGVRGFGINGKDTYFGLECSDDSGIPCSMVLVGSNGIGKTSLFSALEFASMGYSNCAKLRGYKSTKSMIDFLTNINNKSADGKILIKNVDGTVSKTNLDEKQKMDKKIYSISESCFCSDYDIQELETYSYSDSERSFTHFIHSQLNLYGFDIVLNSLGNYKKKLTDIGEKISTNSNRIDELKANDFILNSKIAIINQIHYRSSFIEGVMNCFRGEDNERINIILQRIIDRKTEIMTKEETLFIYKNVKKEFLLLCHLNNLILRNKDKSFKKYLKKISKKDFLFEDLHDIDSFFLPSAYPICLHYLELLNYDIGAGSLFSSEFSVFKKLQAIRENLKTDIERLDSLNKKGRRELQKQLYRDLITNRKEYNQIRNSIASQPIIKYELIQKHLKESDKLIGYIEKKICHYDEIIYKQLEKIIPALCSGSFSIENGEQVVIHYGSIDNLNETDPPVSFDRKKEFEIFIKTRNASSDDSSFNYQKTEPRIYLNTFRHKLFCFALKLGLACCSMIIDRIVYPVVVDDVFDASDFRNRNEIYDVITNLFDKYNQIKVKHNKEQQRLPDLQLILFTQDEIIAERVFRGLTAKNNRAKLERLINPQFYRQKKEKKLSESLEEIHSKPIPYYCFHYPWNCQPDLGRHTNGEIKYTFYTVSDLIRSNYHEQN